MRTEHIIGTEYYIVDGQRVDAAAYESRIVFLVKCREYAVSICTGEMTLDAVPELYRAKVAETVEILSVPPVEEPSQINADKAAAYDILMGGAE